METNRFLLIGGEPATALTFQRLAGSGVEVVHLPSDLAAPLPDFQRVPLMVAVVAPERYGHLRNISQIEAVRAQFPCSPLIVASDSRDADFINLAWEQGIRKMVKLPILEEQLGPLFEQFFRKMPAPQLATVPAVPTTFLQKIQRFLCADSSASRLNFVPASFQKMLAWPTEAALHEQRPVVEMRFFGTFRVVCNGRDISGRFADQKILRTLLLGLAMHGHAPVPRRKLADAVWEYFAGKTTFENLAVRICHLRKILAESLGVANPIVFENECYRITPEIRLRTDLAEWVALWQRAIDADAALDGETAVRCFEKMVETAGGEFLDGNSLLLDEAESWRETTREVHLAALDRLSLHYLKTENFSACAELCRLALQTDPPQQLLHRRLMCAYFALGQRDRALRQFEKCRAAWLAEFGPQARLAAETEELRRILEEME